jgi:hypothetical protein
MSKVVLDVAMSVDGFTAGPNVGRAEPMGEGGGRRQLLRAGLLDEVRIHLVPLLLGEGTPLFARERAELILEGNPSRGP